MMTNKAVEHTKPKNAHISRYAAILAFVVVLTYAVYEIGRWRSLEGHREDVAGIAIILFIAIFSLCRYLWKRRPPHST